MNCLDSKISWNESFFFNLHDSSLGRHVNAASRKSLEIQAYSVTKSRTLSKRKFVWRLVFSWSNASWKQNLGRIDSVLVWISVTSCKNQQYEAINGTLVVEISWCLRRQVHFTSPRLKTYKSRNVRSGHNDVCFHQGNRLSSSVSC